VIRPNGGIRQGQTPEKDLFDLFARFGGKMGLGDYADDPMAFVEPRKSPLNHQ